MREQKKKYKTGAEIIEQRRLPTKLSAGATEEVRPHRTREKRKRERREAETNTRRSTEQAQQTSRQIGRAHV